MMYAAHMTRIKEIREAKGLAPDDMAQHLTMTTGLYRKLEAGQRPLTIPYLIKIANLFEMNPIELVPSLGSGKYSITQQNTTHDTSNGGSISVGEGMTEKEREVWQKLDEANKAVNAANERTIAAHEVTNAALREAVMALKLALGK
jgi:transcriptional regulator with XRE-family HTH domain